MKIPTSYREILQIYGNPSLNGGLNKRWERANIIYINLPYPMRVAGTSSKVTRIRVHKEAAPYFLKAFNNVWAYARKVIKEKYGYDQTTQFYDNKALAWLRLQNLDIFGGSFVYRKKRGGNSLSLHSFGCAIDIDPEHNGQSKKPTMPSFFVKCWTDAQFTWGGKFKGKYVDGMHMQLGKE